MSSAKKLYTLADLAVLLERTPRTIRLWRAAKRIPGQVSLPGRTVRFSRKVIDLWLGGETK